MRLNVNGLTFCTNHNNKYTHNVLFAFVSINSFILGWQLVSFLFHFLFHSLETNYISSAFIKVYVTLKSNNCKHTTITKY
jgi:hypothetical protein